MAHHVAQSAYGRLTDRLNRFPQGAPPSELLTRILKMLFGEREAELAALLPIKLFTAGKAARVWGLDVNSARNILDGLASRALLVDMEEQGNIYYVLPPESVLTVLDYEKASEVIRTASARGISTCYCRHKMLHMQKVCVAPLDICMTFNTTAHPWSATAMPGPLTGPRPQTSCSRPMIKIWSSSARM